MGELLKCLKGESKCCGGKIYKKQFGKEGIFSICVICQNFCVAEELKKAYEKSLLRQGDKNN